MAANPLHYLNGRLWKQLGALIAPAADNDDRTGRRVEVVGLFSLSKADALDPAELSSEATLRALLAASKPGAQVDSDGAVFNPGLGTVTTAYTRVDGAVTGETRTSVVAGVARVKTFVYNRAGGQVGSFTESAWVVQP